MNLKVFICSVALLCVMAQLTESLQCGMGAQFSLQIPGSGPISSELTTTSCYGFGAQCLRVDFKADVGGLKDLPYVVGQCIPYGRCSSVTCHQIKSRLRSQMSYQSVSYKFHSCKTSCCSTNNCNKDTASSEASFATTSLVPSISNGMQCRSGLEFEISVPGAGPVSSEFTTVTCSGMQSQCFRMDYTALINGIRVPYALGQCIENGSADCSTMTCDAITSKVREQPQFASASVEIESCSTVCCSHTLCNAKPVNEIRGKQLDDDGMPVNGDKMYDENDWKLDVVTEKKPDGGSGSIVTYSTFAVFFCSTTTLVAGFLMK